MELCYQFKSKDIVKEGRCTDEQIEEIRNWLAKETKPPIPSVLPDELIVLFLLSCFCDVKNTKITIEAFYRIKKGAPDMFDGRDIDADEKLAKAAKTVITISSPVRLPGNDVIHFFKLQDTNYSNFDLVNSMKLAYMILDVSQIKNPPNRLVVIIDIKGVGLMHLTKIRLGAVKTFLDFLQTAMPLKICQVYILNANYMFDKIMNLVKVFIKSELMSAIKCFPPGYDMNEFHKTEIAADFLPKEYGGDLADTVELHNKTVEKLRDLKEFFINEEKMRKNACM